MNRSKLNYTLLNSSRLNMTRVNSSGNFSSVSTQIPPVPGTDTYILNNAALLENGKPLLLENGIPLVLTN